MSANMDVFGAKALLSLHSGSSSTLADNKEEWEPPVLRQFDETVDEWESISGMELAAKSHFFDEKNFTLKILDQLLVPHKTEFINVKSIGDGYDVIKKMQVRGAPLIATVGMLSLLVDLRHNFNATDFIADLGIGSAATSGGTIASLFPVIGSGEGVSRAINIDNTLDLVPLAIERFVREIECKCQSLLSARPTAVNLANIVKRLHIHLAERAPKLAVARSTSDSGCDAPAAADALLQLRSFIEDFILGWYSRERAENNCLIRNSIAALVPRIFSGIAQNTSRKLVIMTICNTGSLATSSFGTALGVITHLHRIGALQAAIALETRPYMQGARLTAYELSTQKIPYVLIGDSMAAYAMASFKIDAILVGADQVAKNGDTANKIGTYMLAVLARHHKIPFYVVTPTESINPRVADGSQIKVEERPRQELIQFNGIYTAPVDCTVWNPAFDVTPAALISGILTERGNFKPSELAKEFAD